MRKDREVKIQNIFLKLFLITSLFFPAFYSPFEADYLGEYFAGFLVAYLFLALYLMIQMIRLKALPKEQTFWMFFVFTIIYNVLSLYFNVKELHWYWEQINNTIGFLFFAFLVGFRDRIQEELDKILSFFIKAVIISNVLSILYFIAGYTSFIICNNRLTFYRYGEEEIYHEFRHYWLYSHKSDYSVMLLCFLAVCLCYRKRFKKRYGFWLSVLVLGAALITTHSWTGYLGGMVLAGCAVLDRIDVKKFLKSWQGKTAAALTGLIGIFVGAILLSQRNIFTMGDRLPIWKAVMGTLKERPQGLGFWFGEYPIQIRETWAVTNAHNVFLNQMLRFSVPVGIVFTILIVIIAVYCVCKSKTWLSLGMWAALFMLFNMDYSLLSYEMAMVLFCVYLVCVFPGVLRERETSGGKV